MEAALITAIGAAALALVVGLVKFGYDLRKSARNSLRPPPNTSPTIVVVGDDDDREPTGRHELEAVLNAANPEAVSSRLDRLERACASVLRHVSKLAQSFADLSTIAESLDALSQIEAIRSKRDEKRDQWLIAMRDEILAEIKERDLAMADKAAKRTAREIEERFLLHPKRR